MPYHGSDPPHPAADSPCREPSPFLPQPPPAYKLGETGFSTDSPISVSVEHGRLVIEPVKG
ncbi:type I addiction module toxin, SymE family [Citrobacter gillenii]|nr:type I addiction module toxin, SymE family [Citrobacter gillenii]